MEEQQVGNKDMPSKKDAKAKARAEKIARRAKERTQMEEVKQQQQAIPRLNPAIRPNAKSTAISKQSSLDYQAPLLLNLKEPKKLSSANARDVHKEFIRLGLLYSNFETIDSTERCLEMLRAFQSLIHDYKTPHDTTLSRNLMTCVNNQIQYLVSSRPLSVGMGTAIRHLKWSISILDIRLPDNEALDQLNESIEAFIRERINIPADLISQFSKDKIRNGDSVLTFGYSELIRKALIARKEQGIDFKVIIIDSSPLFHGKKMLQALSDAKMPLKYGLLSSLMYYVQEATKIFMGATAMFCTGAMYGEAGSSLVALAGSERGIPVIVLCESFKFSEKTQLDSFVNNELVPTSKHLNNNFASMSIIYDVVPANLITILVTEMGLLPSKSVPVIVNDLKRAELNRKSAE